MTVDEALQDLLHSIELDCRPDEKAVSVLHRYVEEVREVERDIKAYKPMSFSDVAYSLEAAREGRNDD